MIFMFKFEERNTGLFSSLRPFNSIKVEQLYFTDFELEKNFRSSCSSTWIAEEMPLYHPVFVISYTFWNNLWIM